MEMTARKERILASVVRGFVRSGEPVGSKLIADEIGVSSATVRNEMAELIDLGLLEQPHTSAGRVPSQRGYREYIDRLMTVPPISRAEKSRFDAALAMAAFDPERILSCVCRLLSEGSQCSAVVTTPSGASALIKAVQFAQTSRRTAMLLLISSAGTMKTRVFHCDFDLSPEILRVFFRLFNERLAGKAVADVTPAFLQSMAVSCGDMMALVGSALGALKEAAAETRETAVLCSGQMNLLFYPELEARPIMDLLERQADLVELLKGRPGKFTVLLGSETGRAELLNAAVLSSRYSVAGQDAGALAVIGPMRMDYPRLAAAISYLSQEVGSNLTRLLTEE